MHGRSKSKHSRTMKTRVFDMRWQKNEGKNFDNLGPAVSPSAEAFKWKRAFTFNTNQVSIARMLAQATALRAQLVMTALRPQRDVPHVRDLSKHCSFAFVDILCVCAYLYVCFK